MGFPEFVVSVAAIMALNPLAMDMMLPALPNISSAFHIVLANRPQMVLSTFLVGFGVGQFVMGPLSDRLGRRPPSLTSERNRQAQRPAGSATKPSGSNARNANAN